MLNIYQLGIVVRKAQLKYTKKFSKTRQNQGNCLMSIAYVFCQQIISTPFLKSYTLKLNTQQVPTEYVLRRFNNEGCPALKGKPKFFILQACRGDECDFGSIIPTLETQESTICAVDAQGFSFDSLKTTISKDPTWEDMVLITQFECRLSSERVTIFGFVISLTCTQNFRERWEI